MAGPLVEASALSFRYGRRTALGDLSFTLGRGITGLVGVNGAGKTTLMRLLATTSAPSAGGLRVLGRDVRAESRQVRRQIGYMPQSLEVPDRLTVGDFLAWMAWLRGIPRRQRAPMIDEALAAVDLADRGGHLVGSLSGGMRRRMLLAQALVGEPGLVLLDEPTAGLDPEQRVRVRELVADSSADRATVISSHLMEDLVPIADRILMLDAGSLVFDGDVAELAALGSSEIAPGSALSPYEAAFLSLRDRHAGPAA